MDRVVGELMAAVAAAALAAAAVVEACRFHLHAAMRYGLGQKVRSDGPQRHLAKAGTPSMGGVAFMAALGAAWIGLGLAADTRAERLLVAGIAVAGLGLGAIGLWDDLAKILGGGSRGLLARWRILMQIAMAAVAVALIDAARGGGGGFALPVGLGGLWPPARLALQVAAIVGCANAVNFTDGIDGLAASTVAIAAAGLVPVAMAAGASSVLLGAAVLSGTAAGFLAFNWHPARLFMGDVGSMALGGTLGALAVALGTELLLVLLGGLFVVETLSVIAQVVSFQLTGRRVLKMAPLHHHLELCGWSETKIVAWACAIQLLLAIVSALVGVWAVVA